MNTAIRLFAILFALCLVAPVQAAESVRTEPVRVEVLFMNHGPLRATINDLRTLFARYEVKITVAWHDFESAEGEKFMESKGITEHIPLIIWINDKSVQKIDGVDVSFRGFPSGTGPAMFQGSWDMDRLDKALEQATR